jgi:solute:Na+ symporter, SSS family
MIDTFLFYIILFSLTFLYLGLWLWILRSVKTIQNYFLADRSLGIFKLTCALIASQLGGGIILGTAYRAHIIGLWGILYTLGASLGFILLGCGVAARMHSLKITTTAEVLQTHYGSHRLKKIASFISIVSLWGILVAQIVASKTLFLGLNLTDPYLFLSAWIVVIAYAMLGCLQSIVFINIIQVAAILIIFFTSLKWAVPVKIVKYLTPEQLMYVQSRLFNESTTFSFFSPVLYIPMLFSLIAQDIAQKFFAAKTKITATISSFLAAIGLLFFASIPIYFGIMAKIKHVKLPDAGNPLVAVLAKLCPAWLFLLVICAILAAIMSLATSLLCAISSNIVQDFSTTLHLKNRKLFITKLITFCVGISALFASTLIVHGDIIAILEESYRLSVLCLFIPTFIAYIIKPTTSAPAWISVFCGLISYLGLKFSTLSATTKDLSSLSISLLAFVCVYLITYKKR